MHDDAPSPDPDDEPRADLDPAELKHALGRTGRMLKSAGLPFELDEFDAQDAPPPSDEHDSSPPRAPIDAEANVDGSLEEPGTAGGPPA